MSEEPLIKGSVMRWLHRGQHVTWGTDPGEYDAAAVHRTVERFGALFGEGRYFPTEYSGWENVPAAPVMVVSNHSGGTTIPDVWGFMIGWYRQFGTSRPIHPLAHEMVFSTRLTGPFFSRRGVLRANREMVRRVLDDFKRDVMVLPGGDQDTWRPYSARWEVRFAGRTGYARTAIASRVPIVPVAHAGAHETLIVLTTGNTLARRIGLPKLARAEIFPVHLSLPWGLAIGPLPHIPWPARLRYRIGTPIMPSASARADDDEAVRALDQEVRGSVQSLLDELRATAR